MMRKLVFVAALLFAALPDSLRADSVYTWKDSEGVTHYSNKPIKGAERAELPEITRGEVKLTTRKMATCKDHGEINCQAGPDTDGSVICYDGFRGASALYRFNCNSPKLEISEVTDPKSDGGFTVVIRNSKSVAAQKPSILFKQTDRPEVPLDGPDSIEAFGVGEFVFKAKEGEEVKQKPSIAQLNVTCANCP